jgi:hypothetical protein
VASGPRSSSKRGDDPSCCGGGSSRVSLFGFVAAPSSRLVGRSAWRLGDGGGKPHQNTLRWFRRWLPNRRGCLAAGGLVANPAKGSRGLAKQDTDGDGGCRRRPPVRGRVAARRSWCLMNRTWQARPVRCQSPSPTRAQSGWAPSFRPIDLMSGASDLTDQRPFGRQELSERRDPITVAGLGCFVIAHRLAIGVTQFIIAHVEIAFLATRELKPRIMPRPD